MVSRLSSSSRWFLDHGPKTTPVAAAVVTLFFVFFLQGCSLTPIRETPAPITGPGQAPEAVAQPPAPTSTSPSVISKPEQQAVPLQEAPAGQIARLGSSQGRLTPISFGEMAGWADDTLLEAWPAWLRNCQAMARKGEPFVRLCRQAQQLSPVTAESVRRFFEEEFVPHRLTEASPSPDKAAKTNTITGYYEPLVRGARTPSATYQVPLYRAPSDLVTVSLGHQYPELRSLRLRGRLVKTPQGDQLLPYPTRAEIDKGGLLKGQEIAWLEDPVEAFFLQVQGSGKVVLEDGQVMRLGYANQNGHPYKSIGRWLVEQGELTLGQASMQGIKGWVAANPHRRQELLHQNPSVVFFRELPASQDPTEGPIGSLGVPLTAGRSIAVDPQFVALGLPVFLRTEIPLAAGQMGFGSSMRSPASPRSQPVGRLVIAQDTGSAIVGIHRGDFYFGSGPEAGELAGRMRYPGEMVVLVPRGLQYAQ